MLSYVWLIMEIMQNNKKSEIWSGLTKCRQLKTLKYVSSLLTSPLAPPFCVRWRFTELCKIVSLELDQSLFWWKAFSVTEVWNTSRHVCFQEKVSQKLDNWVWDRADMVTEVKFERKGDKENRHFPRSIQNLWSKNYKYRVKTGLVYQPLF